MAAGSFSGQGGWGMLGLLTFGGGGGGCNAKVESLQILDLQRLASLDHHYHSFE